VNTWFRLYNEVVFDPKVQRLSPKMFKLWINFLCLTSKSDGILPKVSDLSFNLHLTEAKILAAITHLTSRGLIDTTDKGLMPHGWDKRQFKSDGSTERVKRFREKAGNVSETLHETVSKQDQTRTDTEQIQNRADQKPLAISSPAYERSKSPKYELEFLDMWELSTRRGSKLAAFQQWKKIHPDDALCVEICSSMQRWKLSEQWQDETKQPHICNWLKRRGWEEEVPRSPKPNGNGYHPPTKEEIDAAAAELRRQGAIR